MGTTVYLHGGLHKTGTSAIQRAFAEHREILRGHRLLYPPTGHDEVGHHNLAWQLAGDARFDPAALTLDGVAGQVAAFDGDAVLSSEDFETFLDRPAALAPLVERLRRAGRDICLVVYLREARGYAESLYVELLEHGYPGSFDSWIDEIRATGHVSYRQWRFQFDHDRVRAALGAFAGAPTVIRDYDAISARDSVVTDFLAVIGRPPDLFGESALRRANERISQPETLSVFCANRLGRPPTAAERALIGRLSVAPTTLSRLCSARSAAAIAAIARMSPGAPATARAERALAAWWAGGDRAEWLAHPIRAAAALLRGRRQDALGAPSD